MVLPASPPPDQQGQAIAPWVEPVAEAFRQLDGGLLVLVDNASNARLGELVRGLLHEHPGLEVVTEAPALEDMPAGSFVVLAVRSEDATWLNLKRPIFKERALKVVLWSRKGDTARLMQTAPDFFDWIARRFDCPKGPPSHAVMGLRAALCARAVGVRFRGTGLDRVFEAALPGRKLVRASASADYAVLLDTAREARRDWIAWTDVRSWRDVYRVSWAHAEAGRRRPFVLENDAVTREAWRHSAAPDLWFVHGQLASLGLARVRLAAAGASSPGRLAALLNLEPEAIDLTVDTLKREVTAALLEEEAWSAADPGAAIARLAVERPISSLGPRWRQSPIVRRAFVCDPRTQRAPRIDTHSLMQEHVHVRDILGLLRRGAKSPLPWRSLATAALDADLVDVVPVWAEHASTTVEALIHDDLAARRAHDPEPSRPFLEEAGTVRARLSQKDLPGAEGALRRLEALITASSATPTWGDRWLYGDVALEVAQAALHARQWALAADLFARGGAQHWAHSSEWVCAAFLEGNVEALLQAGEALRAEAVARSVLAESGLSMPRLLGVHRALAAALAARGRFEEAEAEWLKVLDLRERAFGKRDPGLSSILVGLADALASQGRHAEAQPIAARALVLAEVHDQANVQAQALRLLAAAHSVLGLPDAPDLARRALSALREAFGEDHPLTRSSEPHLRRILGDVDPPT